MPLNITDRAGYDNQPSFTSDQKGVFFTSVRDDAQADIYRYDIATKQTTRVTTTAPESEYSATPIDGGRAISIVRVERDSAQRLWRFPLDGSAPSVILERVRPVGYHAWADDHTLALFVLGSPNTLQLADTRSGAAETLASGIGRSLHRIPGTNRISFVRKVAPDRVVDRVARPGVARDDTADSTAGGCRGLRVASGRIDGLRARCSIALVVREGRKRVEGDRGPIVVWREGNHAAGCERTRRPVGIRGRGSSDAQVTTRRRERVFAPSCRWASAANRGASVVRRSPRPTVHERPDSR